ncbi:hypothetical protein C9374_006036 [Naegleria lovaniensis]|uniref:DNA repair protein RAD51 homolog n=1 Tax=Naegleria lovaniensis TaxID=51637 RepID=A0AA88GNU4_NAELO|nr:uncharacterized protein C9374_006036 [Naegleria lovaniensis]KAG2381652.1 hypothetical protein C9374_006036 [Naegleria lovaniensis]
MGKQKQKESQAEEEEEENQEEETTTGSHEDEDQSWNMIDKLQDVGIGAADIKKLKEAGIYTVESIMMRTKKKLCSIKGLSEAKVDKILEATSKISFSGFVSGNDFMARRKKVIRITTGSSTLDTLLGGGIETMSITEVFGEFRTAQGGGSGKVAVIDSEGTFRPERIGPIAERFGMNAEDALSNILVARAYTSDHQMQLLPQLTAKFAEDTYRVLIVDSVTALFRVDYCGRGELSERQQKLGQYLSSLMKLAEEFNVAVFITNQVQADPSGASMFTADPKKPVGGHILGHASTTRLYLRKGRAEQRICKIYDSPSLPEAEAIYQISNEGIKDAES